MPRQKEWLPKIERQVRFPADPVINDGKLIVRHGNVIQVHHIKTQ